MFRATEQITKDNTFDAFAFCVIVSIFNFYVTQRDLARDARVDACTVLQAIRGGSQLIQSFQPSTSDAMPKGLVGHLWREQRPAPTQEICQALGGLTALQASAHVRDDPSIVQAIELMRCTIERFGLYPKGWLHIIIWPAMLPEGFLDKLEQRNPEAVVLLLYWCAILRGAQSTWFLDGLAERAAQAYVADLDDYWLAFSVWPLSKLRIASCF